MSVVMNTEVDSYEELKNGLLESRNGQHQDQQSQKNEDAPEKESSTDQQQKSDKEYAEQESDKSSSKKFVFRKGDQTFEVDEDAVIEMMADKKMTKMSLRELRDNAAGEVAVKNRMHSLAEEKKKVQSTLNEFIRLSKNNPLGALEFISERAKEADSEFEYQAYLESLAKQAKQLSEMSDSEREAYELKNKLSKASEDLSQKDLEARVVQKKHEIFTKYPEIGDQRFGEMVEAVINDENLMQGCQNEMDVLDVTEKLIQETLLQADIADLIGEIDPGASSDNNLIEAVRDIVVSNPNFDEDDVRDIIKDALGVSDSHEKAKTLSQKHRGTVPSGSVQSQGASDYEILSLKLLEEKQ